MKNQTTRNIGDQVAAAANEQREVVADFVEGIGDRVESSMPFGEDGPGDFARRAKGAFDSTADYIRKTDLRDVVDDVRQYTKSYPVPMLLGAVAVGFLAGRILRRS